MNKRLIGFHLNEAREELEGMLDEMAKVEDYGPGEFIVAMQHLYHHVNTAWNAREATDAEAEPGSDELFKRWGNFPEDLPLMANL